MVDGSRQAGAEEIEITEGMIEVGESVFREWQESTEWDYRAFIRRLYRSMAALRPKG